MMRSRRLNNGTPPIPPMEEWSARWIVGRDTLIMQLDEELADKTQAVAFNQGKQHIVFATLHVDFPGFDHPTAVTKFLLNG